MSVTDTELRAGLVALDAVAQAIREAGTIPSGTVYAAVSAAGVSLPAFESIVRMLVQSRLVARIGHQLTWIGGAA